MDQLTLRSAEPSTWHAEAVPLLQQLVRIESISKNEHAVADFIEQHVRELAIPDAEIARIGNSIVVRVARVPSGETLAFNAHIDTVGFKREEWSHDPLGGVIESGKMYGRGTTDVKSGSAISLALLNQLKDPSVIPNQNLLFTFTDREELGMDNGATDLVKADVFKGVDSAIFFEPTDGKIAYAWLGNHNAALTINGKGGHSSRVRESDITHPMDAIVALHNLFKKLYRQRHETLLGDTFQESATFTRWHGDAGSDNTIPNRATVTLDTRTLPKYSREQERARIAKAIRRVARMTGTDIKVAWNCNDPAGEAPHIPSRMRDLSRTFELPFMATKFWSDAVQVTPLGIPAFNLGPGSIAQAHKPDEYLALDELRRTIDQLQHLIFSR